LLCFYYRVATFEHFPETQEPEKSNCFIKICFRVPKNEKQTNKEFKMNVDKKSKIKELLLYLVITVFIIILMVFISFL
jgi:hypothetical protein